MDCVADFDIREEWPILSEETVINCCSPCLAGLKTGNLFSCKVDDKNELLRSVRELNRRLVPRGLRIMPVKITKTRALIYLYRPDRLEKDLADKTAAELLSERAYPVGCTERCVAELIRRVRHEEDFPHEIGLFLGYPSEDVSGFIKHGAKNSKCVGTWKVYGDEAEAQKKFKLYKKCTRVYKDAYKKHNSLERLVVSSHNK